MAIDFPNSPTENEQYTVGDRTWTWNGTYWELSTSTSTFTAGDSEPVDADPGDIWFDSTIGKTFVNYNGTWVEIGNAATVVDVIADADADTKVQVEVTADSDKIEFTTAGTKRLEIDASGHVIPAANETYDLGSASNRFRDLYLSGSSIDLGGVAITSDGTNLALPPISNIDGDFTVDTNTLHVDSTNNRVGIGTATPSYPLDVVGDVNVSQSITSEGLTVQGSATVASDLTVDTNTLHVDSTNNRVGIGTTSPSDTLTVAGSTDAVVSIISEGSSPNNALAIAKLQGSGDLGHWDAITINGNDNVSYESRITWLFDSIVEGPIIGGLRTSGATTDLTFHTTESEVANERMRIASSGNVGIGTTSPAHDLHVAGGNKALVDGVFSTTSVAEHARLYLNDVNFGIGAGSFGSGSDDDLYLWAYNGAGRGIRFMRTTDGDSAVDGGAWVTSMEINNSGHVLTPEQPRFSTKRYGSVTLLAGVSTTIPFNENEYDVGSNYDKTTGIFTAPISGLYHFETQLLVTKTTNSRVDLKFLVNGSNHWIQEFQGLNTTAFNLSVNGSMTVELSANDNVRVQAACVNADGNVYANSQRVFNWFSGFLIG